MTTSKNKEQFEKWWFNNSDYDGTILDNMNLKTFYDLPLSMQWGVYLEYYDSLGVVIDCQPVMDYRGNEYVGVIDWYSNVVELKVDMSELIEHGQHKTRQEAQTEALKKADEIVNARLNTNKE